MLKHITTIKLEHNISEEAYPQLASYPPDALQSMLDGMAADMIENLLVGANEGGTHSFLNLVRE